MRFRITHLLVVMVIVGLYGTALARPDGVTAGFSLALTLTIFIWMRERREFSVGPDRAFCNWAAPSGLLFALAVGIDFGFLPHAAQKWLMARNNRDEPPYFAAVVLNICSLAIAFIGGALGAYWSRAKPKETTPRRRGQGGDL